ncbi:MAG TPA: FMN-binding glutamate synthase family protein [Solirubrobacteraceae bacterium]|nr:FMN-binding glutamate synthase family protein [Solirubrobacteraceae bacterium]
MRFAALAGSLALCILAIVAAVALGGVGWIVVAVVFGAVAAVGLYDLAQRRHSILRNYPVLGHARFAMEAVRPELQQYFIERNTDGRPFDRDTRTSIYERAKGIKDEQAYGTERDVMEPGYEWLLQSIHSFDPPKELPRVTIGGPDCSQPYEMSLLNVSAMSFGALSGAALTALNRGAAKGGFAHDTGEGGLTEYHFNGADVVWEIGTGYFGARTKHGGFDHKQFQEKAAHDAVKCVSLKLSQGAKPGIGGVLPGAKVTHEIADARSVPQGQTCVSPPGHKVFSTPRELIRFIAEMRELAGGKPAGFKLCIGTRHELLAICKAMLEEGTAPDFIIVDGSEGGTGAAPAEYEDHVGTPLSEGLMMLHNALVGCGLRDRVKIGASGKIATGSDLVKRLAIGADYTNAARAMMMAVGCIQSQRCHTNQCPVGVATQDPKRSRALDVGDKTERVYRYQHAVVTEAQRIIASMGLHSPAEVGPHHLVRRVDHVVSRSYAELYEWLEPGRLLQEPPASWQTDWARADPESFAPRQPAMRST